MGLLPYVYMPLVARWHPQPGSWGDLSTLSGFIHHLRRADYGTFRLYSTDAKTEGLATRLQLYARDLSEREVPLHLAFPLAAIGMMSSLSSRFFMSARGERNRVGIVVAGTYVFYMIVFHALANLPLSEGLTYGVHMRFWQQPNVIVFLWIGIGLVAVLDAIASRCPSYRRLYLLANAAAPAAVVLQLATWFSFCDQSDAWYIRNYAAALLDPLPPQALLFVNFDLQWTALRYLQRCEHRRRDVTILNLSMTTYQWFQTKHDQYPDLEFPGPRLVPYGSPVSVSRWPHTTNDTHVFSVLTVAVPRLHVRRVFARQQRSLAATRRLPWRQTQLERRRLCRAVHVCTVWVAGPDL
ncbi:hypothetical protein PINS_up000790 [Pythium insidiosum]|nr:hypothetical protein PINS_up000790 [Pythium insidiosum]